MQLVLKSFVRLFFLLNLFHRLQVSLQFSDVSQIQHDTLSVIKNNLAALENDQALGFRLDTFIFTAATLTLVGLEFILELESMLQDCIRVPIQSCCQKAHLMVQIFVRENCLFDEFIQVCAPLFSKHFEKLLIVENNLKATVITQGFS